MTCLLKKKPVALLQSGMILYGFIVIKKWMDCQENILNVSRYNYIFIGYSGHKKNTTCWSQVVFCPGHARYSPMAFCITLAISRNFVMMMALVMLLRNPPITGTTKNASLE